MTNHDLEQIAPAFVLLIKSLASGIRKKYPYNTTQNPRPIFQEMEFSPEIKPGYIYEAPPADPDEDVGEQGFWLSRMWLFELITRMGVEKAEVLVTAIDVYLCLREIPKTTINETNPIEDIVALAHPVFEDLVRILMAEDARALDWIEGYMAGDYTFAPDSIDHMNSIYGTEILYTDTVFWNTDRRIQ